MRGLVSKEWYDEQYQAKPGQGFQRRRPCTEANSLHGLGQPLIAYLAGGSDLPEHIVNADRTQMMRAGSVTGCRRTRRTRLNAPARQRP